MDYYLILPFLFALFALLKKKVTITAGITALIMGIIIVHYGGIIPFIALGLTFILTIVTDKLAKNSSDGCRDVKQIFCNVLFPTVAIILYKILNNDKFLIIYYLVIASSLADTMASSIGSLSKKNVYNPLTFKKMKVGESGAVTILGLFASLLGGLIIGVINYFSFHNLSYLLIISLAGFVGSYVDSILGAFFQGKFKCIVCKKEVEEKVHCQKNTQLIKGYNFINNNTVNILNNIIIFILGLLIIK